MRFDYDPATGILKNKVSGHGIVIGARAGVFAYRDRAHTIPKDRRLAVCRKTYVEQNIIWLWMTGTWPKHEVDHVDHDPFNNKWANLREAEDSENNANRRSPNRKVGRLKWVTQRRGKYEAQVQWRRKHYHVGVFPTEQEAHDAAYAVARRLHGQFVNKS